MSPEERIEFRKQSCPTRARHESSSADEAGFGRSHTTGSLRVVTEARSPGTVRSPSRRLFVYSLPPNSNPASPTASAMTSRSSNPVIVKRFPARSTLMWASGAADFMAFSRDLAQARTLAGHAQYLVCGAQFPLPLPDRFPSNAAWRIHVNLGSLEASAGHPGPDDRRIHFAW